jgi:hypothetical protein
MSKGTSSHADCVPDGETAAGDGGETDRSAQTPGNRAAREASGRSGNAAVTSGSNSSGGAIGSGR